MMEITWQPEQLEWKGRSCSSEFIWDKFRTALLPSIPLGCACGCTTARGEGRKRVESRERLAAGIFSFFQMPKIQWRKVWNETGQGEWL